MLIRKKMHLKHSTNFPVLSIAGTGHYAKEVLLSLLPIEIYAVYMQSFSKYYLKRLSK